MNKQKEKQLKRKRRIKRIRARIIGTAERPRLAIFKSLKHVYAQAINDAKGAVVAAVSDFELAKAAQNKKPQEKAKELGVLIAKKLKDKKISKAVFDRRGYKYHGIVKIFADAAREGGIEF